MNRIDGVQYLWLRLRRVPRWAWISAGLGLLLIPVLLIWMAFALLGVAWQGGSSLVNQGREWLGLSLPQAQAQLEAALPDPKALIDQVVPDVQQQVQAQLQSAQAGLEQARNGLQAVLPSAEQGLASAAAGLAATRTQMETLLNQGRNSVDQALVGMLKAPLPTQDVGGEDPAEIPRLPGFVRTAFARDGERLSVSYAGPAAHGEIVRFYRSALAPAGYESTVMAATADTEVVEFRSAERLLTLTARSDGQGRSALTWEVR